MRREGTHDPGHHGPLQDQMHIPLFGGLGMVFPIFPRPGHTSMTICPGPSLLLSCLGPQLTPSPCPPCLIFVCTPSSPPHPLWADPAFPGSLDIPECPTPLAQEVGPPGRNRGPRLESGGEMESIKYPLFLLKLGLITCDTTMGTPGRRTLFPLAPLPNLFPGNRGMHPFLPLPLPPAGQHCRVWVLAVWLQGRQDHTQGGGRWP